MEELLNLYQTMGISPAVYAYGEETLDRIKDRFAAIDKIAELYCFTRFQSTFSCSA